MRALNPANFVPPLGMNTCKKCGRKTFNKIPQICNFCKEEKT